MLACKMSNMVNISDLETINNSEKKRAICLTIIETVVIFHCVRVRRVWTGGLKSKIAGKDNDSRTVLRLGGSSPHVLIVVDVEDIRNIQFS